MFKSLILLVGFLVFTGSSEAALIKAKATCRFQLGENKFYDIKLSQAQNAKKEKVRSEYRFESLRTNKNEIDKNYIGNKNLFDEITDQCFLELKKQLGESPNYVGMAESFPLKIVLSHKRFFGLIKKNKELPVCSRFLADSPVIDASKVSIYELLDLKRKAEHLVPAMMAENLIFSGIPNKVPVNDGDFPKVFDEYSRRFPVRRDQASAIETAIEQKDHHVDRLKIIEKKMNTFKTSKDKSSKEMPNKVSQDSDKKVESFNTKDKIKAQLALRENEIAKIKARISELKKPTKWYQHITWSGVRARARDKRTIKLLERELDLNQGLAQTFSDALQPFDSINQRIKSAEEVRAGAERFYLWAKVQHPDIFDGIEPKNRRDAKLGQNPQEGIRSLVRIMKLKEPVPTKVEGSSPIGASDANK